MDDQPKEQLVLEERPGYVPEIGRWIAALEYNRQVTLARIAGMDPAALDIAPEGVNTIGTLLYHIASAEAGWLYGETLEQESLPAEIAALFPLEAGDASGRLPPVPGVSLDAHLARLATVRRHLLTGFRGMSLAEFRRPRSLEDYDVTPEWVLFHLVEHEAEHRGQISDRRTWAEL